jgi:hypothetical protein
MAGVKNNKPTQLVNSGVLGLSLPSSMSAGGMIGAIGRQDVECESIAATIQISHWMPVRREENFQPW